MGGDKLNAKLGATIPQLSSVEAEPAPHLPEEPPYPKEAPPWYIDRAWSHALHEDAVFNGHLNFFLVFESLLLAGCVTLLSSERAPEHLAFALAVFGVFSTIAWLNVQSRSKYLLTQPVAVMEKWCPYYKKILEERKPSIWQRIPNWDLLGYGMPLIWLVMWATMICFTAPEQWANELGRRLSMEGVLSVQVSHEEAGSQGAMNSRGNYGHQQEDKNKLEVKRGQSARLRRERNPVRPGYR